MKKTSKRIEIAAVACLECGSAMKCVGPGEDCFHTRTLKKRFVCTKNPEHKKRILSLVSLEKRGMRLVTVSISSTGCGDDDSFPQECPQCGAARSISSEAMDKLTPPMCSNCGTRFKVERVGDKVELIPIE